MSKTVFGPEFLAANVAGVAQTIHMCLHMELDVARRRCCLATLKAGINTITFQV